MKYYKIVVWQGHFGHGHKQEKTLYITADNIITACNIARSFPSIQHNRFVSSAEEIDVIEYERELALNKQEVFVNNGRLQSAI